MIIALENAKHELIDMRDKVKDLGSALRIEALEGRVAELEQKTSDPSFWNDQENSSKVLQELKQSKDTIEEYNALCARLEDAIALAEIAIEAEDESCVEEVEGELSAIRAAECTVLVGAAKDGLSVGLERNWKMLGKKPRMIFINRTDEDNSDYNACLDAIRGKFGQAIAPIVVPVVDGAEKTDMAMETKTLTVLAHDRSGYAHWNYTQGIGAYNDDGTLKPGAIVLYVTDSNKNTVTVTSKDGTTVTGIGNILNSGGF